MPKVKEIREKKLNFVANKTKLLQSNRKVLSIFLTKFTGLFPTLNKNPVKLKVSDNNYNQMFIHALLT